VALIDHEERPRAGALADPPIDWDRVRRRLTEWEPIESTGRVTQVVGLVVEAVGPAAHLGDVCCIRSPREAQPVLAEVVGFRRELLLLMPLGPLGQISQGSRVTNTGKSLTVPVGIGLLGRVLDPLGQAIDARGGY